MMSGTDNSQFFKPTGFKKPFTVAPFEPQGPVGSSHKLTLDDAEKHLKTQRPHKTLVSVSLEPGSGKTTVLPFRFSDSSVCVVLPTGFDALAAYRLATGPANLDTGKYKEDNGSNVTYVDSYTAGFLLFKHREGFPFQVVIIDESDSNAGITKTLTELKFPSSFVIHLSGTPQGKETVSTSAFDVEAYDTLPELSDVYFEAVDFIKQRCNDKRSMVMVPSAAVAKQIHSMIKNSRRIDCDMSVEELDAIMSDQTSKGVIVADDSVSRGFNLNLDVVFDFQQTSAGPDIRNITKHEQMQRRMRVGRMKPGTYYYTPRDFATSAFSKWDVFRNNVARQVFGLPLAECDLKLDGARLKDLMTSKIEPYELQKTLPELAVPVVSIDKPVDKPKSRRKPSLNDTVPDWMVWTSMYSGGRHKHSKHRKSLSGSSAGSTAVTSSSGSNSSSSVAPHHSISVAGSPVTPTTASTVTTIPSTSFRPDGPSRKQLTPNTSWTPVIDLGGGSAGGWPLALKSAYEAGDRLCLVKPAQWVYSVNTTGVDHMAKLLGVIREGPSFSPAEFETVCRAWNVLVSRMNFSFAGGKDAWSDGDRVVFILDYFEQYNALALT